jgi:RNase P subunit RPR2
MSSNVDVSRKVMNWIDEKWPDERRTCEVCGTKKWGIQTHFTTPLVFDGAVRLEGSVYPAVTVICDNCGNTKFFNAVKMKVFPENPAPVVN